MSAPALVVMMVQVRNNVSGSGSSDRDLSHHVSYKPANVIGFLPVLNQRSQSWSI